MGNEEKHEQQQQVNPEQQYLESLIKKFEEGKLEDPTAKVLIGKFMAARRDTERLSNRITQLKQELESTTAQLQQTAGRGGGYLEAVLALCPMKPEPKPVN